MNDATNDGGKQEKPRQVICNRGDLSAVDACNVHSHLVSDHGASGTTVSLLLLYGSWNVLGGKGPEAVDPCQSLAGILYEMCSQRPEEEFRSCPLSVSSVRVDRDGPSEDASIDLLGAPPNLPALAVVSSGDVGAEEGDSNAATRSSNDKTPPGVVKYVDIDPSVLLVCLRSKGRDTRRHEFERVANAVGNAIGEVASILASRQDGHGSTELHADAHMSNQPMPDAAHTALGPALRIFVAGDRSQVGKSSVCLGLLGTLLKMSYPPSSIAYIKPATQCEATQLVAMFCDRMGIAHRPIGPILYYKGFTRAFLAGQTEGTDELLAEAGRAVDDMAEGRRVVIVDGVGYPAVGSVCGTDNAAVAAACGRRFEASQARTPIPVLLVGKSGVGDAIDSFNLNASYFESKGVHVLGSVFNRLALDGFYSLENCKKAVTSYFDQYKPGQRAFGFIPEVPGIAKSREEGKGTNAMDEDDSMESKSELEIALDHADKFVKAFSEHVDVAAIVKAAENATKQSKPIVEAQKRAFDVENDSEYLASSITSSKKAKLNGTQEDKDANGPSNRIKKDLDRISKVVLSREQIEQAALNAGAAGG